MNVEAWAKVLAAHPEQAFARYIREGLKSGFRIGFQHGSPLKSATANMLSAEHHSEVAQNCLQEELSSGQMLGLSLPQKASHNYTNRFSVTVDSGC